jgi:hypothetical protein
VIAHDGMLGGITEAAEIAKETGCTLEQAFFSQRNLANIRVAVAEAIVESAQIPREQKH